MNQYDNFQGERSWYTTRIKDLHGNWIRIDAPIAGKIQIQSPLEHTKQLVNSANRANLSSFLITDAGLAAKRELSEFNLSPDAREPRWRRLSQRPSLESPQLASFGPKRPSSRH